MLMFALFLFACCGAVLGSPFAINNERDFPHYPRAIEGRPLVRDLEERQITSYSPDITFPTSGSVFTAGDQLKVSWDLSDIPSTISVQLVRGRLLLGYTTTSSIELLSNSPLSPPVALTDGSTTVELPISLSTRSSYFIAWTNEDGTSRTSATFTINANPDAPSAASGGPVVSDTPTGSLIPLPTVPVPSEAAT
ncbi:hypothetical protein BT69DRAFT_1355767, partial [Atractiella rhizophila]